MKIEEMDEFIESWKRCNHSKINYRMLVVKAIANTSLKILESVCYYKLNEYSKQIKTNT